MDPNDPDHSGSVGFTGPLPDRTCFPIRANWNALMHHGQVTSSPPPPFLSFFPMKVHDCLFMAAWVVPSLKKVFPVFFNHLSSPCLARAKQENGRPHLSKNPIHTVRFHKLKIIPSHKADKCGLHICNTPESRKPRCLLYVLILEFSILLLCRKSTLAPVATKWKG